jgi:N-acetylglucosaminyldiphosphoundecaprenol N-acetyl-beta-D-mannosaminyltransferase
MSLPRINVLGVAINAIDLSQAVQQIESWIESGTRSYVNVCTVHTVMECRRDAGLRHRVNAGGLATPDGMPLVWLGRLHGHRTGRVYGPDLMLELCRRGAEQGHRHYFYGSTPAVLEDLLANLSRRFPGLRVAGSHSPPRRPADAPEDAAVLERIDASGADVVWVGLGTPKQDHWIARHRPLLRAPVLIAVGAAFDFHAGRKAQAPRWMQRAGLEWLFRLAHEPRRLARRYLLYNPWFLAAAALQLSGLKRYPVETGEAV